MKLYKYDGAIYNGNVAYKKVVEYVHAISESQAIIFLERRFKFRYKEISFIKLKEKNLHEIPDGKR